jgi:2-oxoglutarate dehydrogenase E1 component
MELDILESLAGSSPHVIEGLYAKYQANPEAVEEGWRGYFASLEDGVATQPIETGGPSWGRSDWPPLPSGEMVDALVPGTMAPLEVGEKKERRRDAGLSEEALRAATLDSIRALMMIRTYRVRGHLHANLDPLGLEDRPAHIELDPSTYGFGPDDMDRPIFVDGVLGLETATLREILVILERTYCSSIGVEFMHINDPEVKSWVQHKIEGRDKEIQFSKEGKFAILDAIIEAEQFENFLAKKYIGTKRFGLDGGETLIPALEAITKVGGAMGCKEIILGMPHRGRLNVLTNYMQKPYSAIFHEFHGGSANPDDVEGSGDVKYHLGTSADREFDGNVVHLSLTANPSHLEAVDPVVQGKARAKQTSWNDVDRTKVMPVLMHGDAAFAGQGIIAECFMMSGLDGYSVGGTIHVVVNNQIGFTTAPDCSRSGPYPSDMAKAVQAPIFHVNGDDPEATVWVTKLATEFRQTFHSDVVVDMLCYRRYGHNEGDEPAFTQPIMYAAIKNHKSVATLYKDRLIGEGLMSDDDYKAMVKKQLSKLESDFAAAEEFKPERADTLEGSWDGFGLAGGGARRAETGANEEMLYDIGRELVRAPEGFNLHRTLKRVLDAKERMFEAGAGFDWATAEALAFGSLMMEGFPVRLSGQDCRRGTFSQRHSVLIDQKTEDEYCPLNTLNNEAPFEVLNSPLSEFAVLGFEYGFTLADPKTLTLWEGQFGDFANGAQVMFDQFISSGEAKWLRMSGLVVLLPHGYEGQGPEHSSARLERFLQLSAEDNWQVANCTTPAQYFHILRRQMHRGFRKPLIIMTPKSLLRHKQAVSTMADMAQGSQFHRLLWDSAQSDPKNHIKLKSDAKIKRVICCSGKVYYELLEEREKRKQDDTYLLRVEQLYPFPQQPLVEELGRFKNVEKVIWCQEEPKNMGSWHFLEGRLEGVLKIVGSKPGRPLFAGRLESAATATGLASRHAKQQSELIDQALTL